MSLRKVVGLLAGFALAVGLIGAGVGAQFTDLVTAKENINVGTFQCQIVAATPVGPSTVIAADGKSVTYTAPTIVSSAPGSAPFSFTVQNTGSIAQQLTVSTSPVLSSPWSIIGAPFAPVPLAAGDSTTYNTGVQWTELSNANLGQQGTVTWNVTCGEVPVPAFNVGYYTSTGGGTTTADGFCRYTTPQALLNLDDGDVSQSVSAGSVNLSITDATGYIDTGFYVPLGTLGSLTTYSITSSGDPIGTNLYFDTDATNDNASNGDWFTWSGNCMTSLGAPAYPDTYASAPGGTGTVTVGGATPFYMQNGPQAGNSFTLAQLQAGDVSGITASTQVAAWVGITAGKGQSLSVTITAAP